MYDDKALHSFQTGLRFRSGKAKPAYEAYRLPIVVHSRGRRGVYIWGRVRPGTGTRYVQLRVRRAQRTGPRIHTNSRGYFGVKRKSQGQLPLQGLRAHGLEDQACRDERTARPI